MKTRLISGVISLLLLITVIYGGYLWYLSRLQPLSASASAVPFVVSPSETGNSIAGRLGSSGLVKSVAAAKIYLRLNRISNRLKPGEYSLSPSFSVPQIFSHLVSGPKDIRVTLPEGWRHEQIAARLQNQLPDFSAAEFNRLSSGLEGQLFPDTYLLPAQTTPSEVLKIFQKNFLKKTQLDLNTVSGQEVLVIASLIEREAKHDLDRGIISGIIHKRLAKGWPLQLDATVQYAADSRRCSSRPDSCDWWLPITDTGFVSPFNTYQSVGLPPSPICNPGLASIQAAAAPTSTPYWYYLTGNDGQTYYATTLPEHNLNIDKHLRR